MVETLGLEMMFLFAAVMAGIVISHRLGQSAILGVILLGVFVGPTGLNLVSYTEPVHVLAEIGAIIMLFTVGLESNYREVFNKKNLVIAIFGVIIPFLVGWGISSLFGYNTIEGLFIGTAFTATSIAITAHILQERGVLSGPVAKTIIGAAVVDDILGLLTLSMITSITGDVSAWTVIFKAIVALAFVGACIAVIKPVNKMLYKVWLHTQNTSEHVMLFSSLILMFGYAGIASAIGLSSIVGAFLAGITIIEGMQHRRVHEGAEYLQTLFGAIFFVSLGLVMDFKDLPLSAWIFAIVITALAVVSKFVACIIPARYFGHNWRESTAVAFGMVPRGEVAMIVGLIGLSAGIIGESAYGAIIVMAFFTTVITPIFLRWSLPKNIKKYAIRS